MCELSCRSLGGETKYLRLDSRKKEKTFFSEVARWHQLIIPSFCLAVTLITQMWIFHRKGQEPQTADMKDALIQVPVSEYSTA